MLRVRDIMTPSVVTLAPEQTLREAVETLVTCRIGGAPVVDGGKVVGVLSAPDILEFESVTPHSDSRNDEPVEEKEEVDDAAQERDDDDVLSSAYFTDWWPPEGPDVAERFASAEGAQWDVLSDHSVSEAMTRTICAVAANNEVSFAAQRMLSAGAQRALVTEGGELVGIVTTTDILRAVAEHRLTVRQFVFEK